MATIQDFADRVLKIDGVKSYILIRNDGHIVTHNIDDPDNLASMLALCGLSCDSIKAIVGFNHFKYAMFSKKDKQKVFLFPIDNYYLGIVQLAEAYSPDIINSVTKFIQAITKQRATT